MCEIKQCRTLTLNIVQLTLQSVCTYGVSCYYFTCACQFSIKNLMSLSSYSMLNVVKLRKTALTGHTSSSGELGQILSNLSLFCSPDMFTSMDSLIKKNSPIKFQSIFRAMIIPFRDKKSHF